MSTDQWTQKGKDHFWLSFGRDASYYDETGSIIREGEGSFIVDLDGNRYLDTMAGQATLTLGYSPEPVIEAMQRQLRKISTNPSGWPASVEAIQLAEKLSQLSPPHNKVFYSCNGTDGNETALKIARQYFRLKGEASRYKSIVRKGEYHGASLGMIAGGGYTFRRKSFEPLPSGFVHVRLPYSYRCPYGCHPACTTACADEIEQEIQFHDPGNIACVILEITTCGGGVIKPPKEYVQKLRRYCDEYGILMIVDEVVTGFGRTGTWFAYQQYDIEPDMVVFGKGVAAGFYPLSGVLVKEEIADIFQGHTDKTFHHGYTFGGAPLGCAAALANIDTLEEEKILEQIPEKSRYFVKRFSELQDQTSIIGEVRHHGMMFGLELVQDKHSRARFADEAAIKHLISESGKKHGLHLIPFGSVLMFLPPLNISEEDMVFLCDGVEKVIKEVEAAVGHLTVATM